MGRPKIAQGQAGGEATSTQPWVRGPSLPPAERDVHQHAGCRSRPNHAVAAIAAQCKPDTKCGPSRSRQRTASDGIRAICRSVFPLLAAVADMRYGHVKRSWSGNRDRSTAVAPTDEPSAETPQLPYDGRRRGWQSPVRASSPYQARTRPAIFQTRGLPARISLPAATRGPAHGRATRWDPVRLREAIATSF